LRESLKQGDGVELESHQNESKSNILPQELPHDDPQGFWKKSRLLAFSKVLCSALHNFDT
jgi:hypothetical protein